ncbi:MAG: glycerol-3-phosphate dehydrogenase/oxidase [Anaerolineaceae bacterium]|nr:glycerol-3-phosphate dehydrogenase/oxidase [Anaerolineaceae bacterium]
MKMWTKGWRESILSQVDEEEWDIVIIGGGITGAGILREAVNAGLKTLLVEARDFSFGTSSRSSKLIHGGIRYLRNRQYGVTYESVRERERMLKEARFLVTPLPFLLPVFTANEKNQRGTDLQILIYDLMAGRWQHRSYTREGLLRVCPQFNPEGLLRGYLYGDALMDDSRVLLRVIREAAQDGGVAVNYTAVEELLKDKGGKVCGVVLKDRAAPSGKTWEVKAKLVINAAGPWVDEMRSFVQAPPRLRKLRGSHVILPLEKQVSKEYAVHFLHPKDYRTMFAFQWEGIFMAGTTDLDHAAEVEHRQPEPCASLEEIDYIIEGLQFTFPEAGIRHEDVISTFAGLRPVVNTGKARPSDESRAHVIWDEDGLITIAGGKYTIFRVMASDVLNRATARLSGNLTFPTGKRLFARLPDALPNVELPLETMQYLAGRHAADLPALLAAAAPGELESLEGLPNIWAELRWAARSEGVVHLDDLLLRRVRIGLTLPNGALGSMERIRAIAQPELGWDDTRWEKEVQTYREIWQDSYSPSPQW